MPQLIAIVLLFGWLGLLGAPALAAPSPDKLDVAKIVRTDPDMPARGTLMEAVRESLGEPIKILGPVGEPPITRWVYDQFIVFFEGKRVLHSVIPRPPDG